MEKYKGALAVLIGAASFGILSTFVKKAYNLGFNLAEVTGIQAFLGAIFLWVLWLMCYTKSDKNKYPSKSAKWKIIIAGISTGTVSVLYYKSVSLVPASLAIVLLMQYIWIGQLIEMLFFKVKPSLNQLIVIFCILAGTVIATGLIEEPLHSFSLEGIVYGLLAATAYAVFIIVNGRVGNDYPPLKKSALMITGAFVFIAIILQPISLFKAEVFTGILSYGLLLALFGTVIPPLLFSYGMPKTGYSLGSVLGAIELPVAITMSSLYLNESVSLLKWGGVLFILLTIIWKNYLKTKS